MRIEFNEVKITATLLINEQKVKLARLRIADNFCSGQLNIYIRGLRTKNTLDAFKQTEAYRCLANSGRFIRHMRSDRALERS